MNNYEVAEVFWTNKKDYPAFPNTLKRRLIDVNFVVNKVLDMSSVLDLGCGDGALLLSLREFTELKKFYGYDISSGLLKILKNKWGKYPGLITKAGDFIKYKKFPKVDLTLSFGAFPFIFEETDLHNLLEKITSDILIVRSPCTLLKDDEIINKYSEELNEQYASIYRTPGSYISILSEHFTVCEIHRAYPDKIESKYGTKHFFFVCRRRHEDI